MRYIAAMEQTITLAELAKRLNVTAVTISQWRKGSTLRRPLRVNYATRGAAKSVTIEMTELHRWLTSYRPDLIPLLTNPAGTRQ